MNRRADPDDQYQDLADGSHELGTAETQESDSQCILSILRKIN